MRWLALILLLVPIAADAASWYVRPAGGTYGTENGTDYANAWDDGTSVVWGAGGVAVDGSNFQKLLYQRTGATKVVFTINGVVVATHTTNLPTSTTSPCLHITNSAAAAKTIDTDYFEFNLTGVTR